MKTLLRLILPTLFACVVGCIYLLHCYSNPTIHWPVDETKVQALIERVHTGPTPEQVILNNNESLEDSIDAD